MKRIYLDWAAATPTSARALRAFTDAAKVFGNPSAAHEEGRAGKALLEDARRRIAVLAGAKPDHVVFTAGATEANVIAMQGHIRALVAGGKRPQDLHVLYLSGAHASMTETAATLEAEGVLVEALPRAGADVDLEALKGMIRPETVLVSLEAVSAETGARFDTRGVRRALDEVRKGIVLHVDACQLPLAESFERTRLAADLISLDAQKVGGMRGIGCLIVAPQVTLLPVIEGGGQERGLRSGTESPALALAFATALEEAAAARDAFQTRAQSTRESLVASVLAALPDAVVNEGKKNVAHILNFSFPARDTDYLAALLDERGFAVSTRSACETDSANGSRAVFAQTGDALRAGSTLRISWGPETAADALKRFGTELIEAVRFLDRNTL